MRDSEAVFSPRRRLARLELRSAGSAMLMAPGELDSVGGRCDIQSCTSRETFGFDSRFSVFCEEGGVVIMMVGDGEKGVEGR